ncbi:MAG: hypothetical protein QGG38_07875 [Nitrospinaceae bacterium]|jgi:hypothetical protein|nr:hypothetical protein [Nitrospinaceae bacterium]HAK37613.1 hypothetical protein [Nitrospina sp.]
MFFVGGWILSTCSKWEREDAVKLKDPKLMYGHRKSDIVKPKSMRGAFMTITGLLLSVSGIVMFLMCIQPVE